MNIDRIKEIINEKPNLSTALGMEFISTPEDDTCMARMKVDERNRQPSVVEHRLLWPRIWQVWHRRHYALDVPA